MTLLLQSQAAHVCLSFHLRTKSRQSFGGNKSLLHTVGMLGLISWLSALQDPPAAQSCGPAPPVKPHLCDMVQARTWPPSHSSGREKNAGVGWTEVRMPWAHYGTHLWWMQLWQIKVGLALVALHNALRLHYLCCNRGPAGPILSRKICLNQHSGWGMGNPTALVESQRTNQEINPLWQTPF